MSQSLTSFENLLSIQSFLPNPGFTTVLIAWPHFFGVFQKASLLYSARPREWPPFWVLQWADSVKHDTLCARIGTKHYSWCFITSSFIIINNILERQRKKLTEQCEFTVLRVVRLAGAFFWVFLGRVPFNQVCPWRLRFAPVWQFPLPCIRGRKKKTTLWLTEQFFGAPALTD